MIADNPPARGGQAIPVNQFHTIPPVCIAFIPKGHTVPKNLRHCIIRFSIPKVVA